MNPTTSKPSGESVGTHEEYMVQQMKIEALREKKWEEASIEEKIEKLRMAIFELPNHQYIIGDLSRKIDNLVEHSHDEKGEMVVPFKKTLYNGGGLVGSNSALRKNPLD